MGGLARWRAEGGSVGSAGFVFFRLRLGVAFRFDGIYDGRCLGRCVDCFYCRDDGTNKEKDGEQLTKSPFPLFHVDRVSCVLELYGSPYGRYGEPKNLIKSAKHLDEVREAPTPTISDVNKSANSFAVT